MSKRSIRRGWRKIEEYRHKMSGVKVGIYLCSATSVFDAEVDGQNFSSREAADLRKQLDTYLNERTGVEWQEIIEVDLSPSYRWSRSNEKLELGFERCLVSGLMFNEKYLKTTARRGDYDTPETRLRDAKPLLWDRKKLGEFKPPCSNDDRSMIYIPYSEEAVAILTALKERIVKAREDLQSKLLVEDDDYRVERLAQFLREYKE